MAWSTCGRCGKRYPKGDKIAAYYHNLTCKKSVLKAGPYLGKKK